MREIKAGGTVFKVRCLKRKEVRMLKREGLNLTNLTAENADDAMDRVFSMIFSTKEIAAIDKLDNPEALAIWRAVLNETFGAADEEKN